MTDERIDRYEDSLMVSIAEWNSHYNEGRMTNIEIQSLAAYLTKKAAATILPIRRTYADDNTKD